MISRILLTRAQSDPTKCNDGYGLKDFSTDANCDYKKAPFFNVLAAFWIQFMTHDWFTHLEEGHNADGIHGRRLPESDAKTLNCRPGDRIDKAYVAESSEPGTFTHAALNMPHVPRRRFATTPPPGGTPHRSTGTTNARSSA